MKRLVLLLMAIVTLSFVHAANPVKKTKGDTNIFRQEILVLVEIDDHKTIIDRTDNQTADVYYESRSKQEYEKFIDDVDRGHASFVTFFNENKKGDIKLEMTDSDKNAPYTLKVKVDMMNVGNAGGMAWGMSRKAGGAQIEGTMILIENKTKDVVCEFEFSKVKGLMAPVFRGRVISVYRYLADALLKIL